MKSKQSVYIASRKAGPLKEAADELTKMGPGVCYPIVADLGSKAGCDHLAEEIKKRESKIHVLVNNSGMSWGAPLFDFPEKEGWDRLLALNVKSLFYTSVALFPLLNKDATNTDPGRIINIASVAAISPAAEGGLSAKGSGTYSYQPSKAAAAHLTRVLANTWNSKNVTVNAVLPGVFESRMTQYGLKNHANELNSRQPTGRIGDTEDMAGIALFLASRGSAHITGVCIPIDGGASLASSGTSKI